MTTGYETLLVETDGPVCVLTLNRPDKLNAFNGRMTEDLSDAFKQIERDAGVRAVVLTGAGRAFCSGQDLADLESKYRGGEALVLGDRLRGAYNPLIRRIVELDRPVIAAVNGVAAGAGCSLALACDLRVASDKASFIEVFINVGLVPDSGSSFFLPRLIGFGRALEMCVTGDKLSAADALTLGLVCKVVPGEDVRAAAMELARRLAAMPTKAIALTKRLMYASATNTLAAQLEAEAYAQETAGKTQDHREGVMAFLDKRKPRFTGA
ncbi:MAG: 1,2-epoxyphenylacetyl-CoA isomerase [Phycisphaerae bacterium]|nr:1,2-epoxyphenylacetyl-CoA isomerase [Phycisphaerae bacterium]